VRRAYTSVVSRAATVNEPGPSGGQIGGLLRHWRAARRVSQLDLALDADVSSRHLSFVETGRAQPSREMVLRLAEALEVPLRERNALLLAAGFAPVYRETGLDAPEMAEARRAVEFILAQQEPYPAIVVDRHWNVLLANAAAGRFLSLFPLADVPPPPNAMRLLFHPRGLRPYILNWEEVAGGLIQRVHREAAGGPPDAGTKALLAELLGYPGVPPRWRTPELDKPPAPLVTIVYGWGDRRLRFFSTVTTFGTPQDVTLQELRIECFFPGDDATRDALVGLAAPGSTTVPA
jgi:transcriptional regulator with XRE-family HTH domain